MTTTSAVKENGQQLDGPARRIAVLGTAESSRDLAPFDDPLWEIWSLSNRVVTDQVKRWDKHFELHSLEQFERNPEARPYVDWMHRQPVSRPIYLQDAAKYPGIVAGVQFPYDSLIAEHGQYFTSTIAWQIAFAIQEGATEIGVWGVDLAQPDEYYHQRPCVEHLLGFARGRGVKITLPPQTSLFRPRILYGLPGDAEIGSAINAHKAFLQKAVKTFETERDQAQLKMAHAQGALENTFWIEQIVG